MTTLMLFTLLSADLFDLKSSADNAATTKVFGFGFLVSRNTKTYIAKWKFGEKIEDFLKAIWQVVKQQPKSGLISAIKLSQN